jgi:hypothetical protein
MMGWAESDPLGDPHYVFALCASHVVRACMSRYYTGPKSDHFDGVGLPQLSMPAIQEMTAMMWNAFIQSYMRLAWAVDAVAKLILSWVEGA